MKEHKLLALFLILLTTPIGGIGLDMYSPALPEVASSLHLSITLVQWTISIFVLGLCIGMLIFGSLSDSWGRRPVMLLGALAFLVTSLAVTLVHSGALLLGMRFIQGIAAGALQVIARGMVTDVFDNVAERRKVLLYMTTTWGLGPVLAPWIGSLLEHAWGWEGCFYGFAFYAVVLLLSYLLFFKETHLDKQSIRIRQLSSDFITMLRNGQFMGSMWVMGFGFAILMLFGLVGPFYIQKVLGYSPLVYGRFALIAGAAYLVGTLVCRSIQFLSPLQIMGIGLIFVSVVNVVCWLFACFLHQGHVVIYISDVFLSCAGLGVIYPVAMGISVNAFPHMAGRAGALSGAGNTLITSVVTSVIALWHYVNLTALIELYMLLFLGVWALFWILARLEAREVCTQQ